MSGGQKTWVWTIAIATVFYLGMGVIAVVSR